MSFGSVLWVCNPLFNLGSRQSSIWKCKSQSCWLAVWDQIHNEQLGGEPKCQYITSWYISLLSVISLTSSDSLRLPFTVPSWKSRTLVPFLCSILSVAAQSQAVEVERGKEPIVVGPHFWEGIIPFKSGERLLTPAAVLWHCGIACGRGGRDQKKAIQYRRFLRTLVPFFDF